MEIEDWPCMDSCPHRVDEPLRVLAVETSHIVVTGTDGVPYRATCLPKPASPPLHPGDRLVVNTVHRDHAVVERVTQGRHDGCFYELGAYQLVSAEA
jgi:hypothetical protein